MKLLVNSSLFLGLASMALAGTWTGKLIDANCDQQPGKESITTCDITASTASFALHTVDGKMFKLDAAGNAKAAAMVKGDIAKYKTVQFKVDGDLDGDMVKVQTLETLGGVKPVD